MFLTLPKAEAMNAWKMEQQYEKLTETKKNNTNQRLKTIEQQ